MYGLHANYLAIQVLGGYGYTREYPVERLYRDNRLNEIHEGTTGIQSLDLLGRKVPMDDGAALKLLLRRIRATAGDARAVALLAASLGLVAVLWLFAGASWLAVVAAARLSEVQA